MKYQYLKLFQILILSVASINDQNFIIYVITLLVSVIPSKYNIFASVVNFSLMTFSIFTGIQTWKFIALVFIIAAAYIATKRQQLTNLHSKYIIPVLLISISLASISQNQIIRISHLAIFYVFIILTYFYKVSVIKFPLIAVILIWIFQGIFFSIQHFDILIETAQYITYNSQWWYFMSFPLTITCSIFVLENINRQKDQENLNIQINGKKSVIQQDKDQQIQMQQISQKSQKKIDSSNQQQLKQKLLQKDPQQFKHLASLNYSLQQSRKNLSQTQSDSLNLILILPFFCQNSGITQIPLYLYFLMIHYNKSSEKLFFTVILCIFLIIYNVTGFNETNLKTALLLRMAVVLMINKNVRGVIEVTQIIKKVWLKSSFVFVLALLFWYSLITVNIFHLILTLILLIFIVTDSKQHELSYRHRRWIYLVTFFNIFLILRFVYQLLVHYKLYQVKAQDSFVKYILDLSGISYCYLKNFQYFNLIPLVISTAIAFQYLTYQSRIYNSHHTSPLLPLYQQKINLLIKILTIFYYKVIPWMSYLLIIGGLLVLQFSCTSLVLLIWILIAISLQIILQNSLVTYRKLYKMWIVYSRILAFQIIIRYAFEFLNFPILLNIFKNIPFFQDITSYKQFLGLAIRQADFVYFKAISKFQLMVGIDLISIFICFLVIQYYTYLIVYYQIQSQQISNISRLRAHQQQRINLIYSQFIDFKLTHWLKGFNLTIKYFSEVYLTIYYPIISIYSCLFPSFSLFLLLMIAIKFYLRKNTGSYQKYIQTNLIPKVKDLFLAWKQSPKTIHQKAIWIYDCIKSGKNSLKIQELQYFQKLRNFVLWIISTSLIFNYFSRVFKIQQIYQLVGEGNKTQLIYLRWLLYINGTSIDSETSIIVYLMLLLMTIFEVKCCRFIIKIHQLIQKRSSHKVDQEILMAQKGKKLNVGQSPIKMLQKRSQSIDENIQMERQKNYIAQGNIDGELLQNIKESRQNEIQIQKNIDLLKSQDDWSFDIQYNQHISTIKPYQLHQSFSGQTMILVNKLQTQKFIEMQVSLLQGTAKLIQRCFVMVLVFLSIIQNHHPFGIIYLVCAILLTFLGAYSILSLSRVLTVLITLQYMLILMNYTNFNLFQTQIQQFKRFQYSNSFEFFIKLPDQWADYLTFGDTTYQKIMLIVSFVLLALYQFYFVVLNFAWFKILNSLTLKLSLNKVQKKIYDYFIMIYTYCLIYSPLCITICSLGIYLLDFTTTNLFLSILSIIFLFKSVLVQQYSQSRLFWKLYFYILQFFIVIFMLIYDILSIPMYKKYCIKILCSSQQTHTKINKAVLLFVLQIGIDLMKSTYFITAMQNLKYTIKDQAIFSKLAIAYKQNDKKISKQFKDLTKQNNLTENLLVVKQFLDRYAASPEKTFQNKKQIVQTSQQWIDSLLQILPSFVDSSLILTPEQAKSYIKQQNFLWIKYREISGKQLFKIKESYLDQFGQLQSHEELLGKIKQVGQQREEKYHNQSKYIQEASVNTQNKQSTFQRRKSLIDNIHNYQPEDIVKQRVNQLRQSLVGEKNQELKKQIEQSEKKKLVFLLVLQSIISNWQYLTYGILILQHVCNFGLLTLPFPILAFCYGLIHTYQASKKVWRLVFVLTILPISFKFGIAIGLIRFDSWLVYILIGDNTGSILLEYFIILSVLIQCLILKIIGLYDQGVNEVEGMKMALIRNIVNSNDPFEIQHLKILLKNSVIMTQTNVEHIFCRYQQKPGYSYSTLMTTVQLLTLFFIFFFYDEMAARKQVTIYQMISYNQFTAGMVILTLIQLFFLLAQRFVNIADLKQYSSKWELTLIAKYFLLIIQLCYSEFLIVFFFPYSSQNFSSNSYISVFYIFNVMSFLLSALQIKYGIDQKSKGFMDRYTWYNGFIYMAFRAVPFLFQFKIFSDWTFSKTSLRLFDWIKLEQIFGRMYVAKCNSLFLQGKQIGSKIQWWKKLLMGFPLLFAIILLLFGPLVLFSNLNPLASKNQISSGYLQLCLKINKTNQYPFYTNSHIANIANLSLDSGQEKILQTYDIQQQIVQLIHLDEFSDQYWEISEGSYFKVLQQPQSSIFQIILRIKFQRNQTGSTPMYTINTYSIPKQDVPLFKQTLLANATFKLPNFLDSFLRLDNNNGLHVLGNKKLDISFHAEQAQRNNKMFWVIDNGINLKVASDKYSKAIFGYSVMSFYISIILVIANYFRFLFQGSANGIILSDIPIADPILSLCNGIYQARFLQDIQLQETLFWTIIDLLRSPDEVKSLSGSYLEARLQTKRKQIEKPKDIYQLQEIKKEK